MFEPKHRRWTIVSDNDGRQYVVPADKAEEFHRRTEAVSAFWDMDNAPDNAGEHAPDDPADEPWAHHIEGGRLTFTLPEYEGEELKDA